MLARFTVLRVRASDRRRPGTSAELRRLERIADDLAAAGWLSSSLDARLLARQDQRRRQVS